jgi:deoxycytidine triphosphate deaminase
MSIYSRNRLEGWAQQGGISPWLPESLGDRHNEHCIDVRLGCLATDLCFLPEKPSGVPFAHTLSPGECMLGLLLEWVHIPDKAAGEFSIRSEWAKKWLGQVLSKDIKAGWQGHLVVELKNYHHSQPLTLSYGDRIGQISLHDID